MDLARLALLAGGAMALTAVGVVVYKNLKSLWSKNALP